MMGYILQWHLGYRRVGLELVELVVAADAHGVALTIDETPGAFQR